MHGLYQYEDKRKISITASQLVDFEKEVAEKYEAGKIKGPIHLSDGNEEDLIKIFANPA